MTVNDVLAWYAMSQVRSFSPVAAMERSRLTGLFGEMLGNKDVSQCIVADLLAFISKQGGCVSNHTRKRIRSTICRPFNAAVDAGLIQRNPFKGAKIRPGKSGRDWTDGEYQAVLRQCAPHVRRLIVFCRFSGARPGEARIMKWVEVRADMEAIILAEHKTSHATEEPRRIHFNVVLLGLLEWMSRHRKGKSPHVFTNRMGRPWTIGALVKYMRTVRQRAGLPSDTKLHGLRHTFATNALMNGVDIRTLADLLGHATVKTTERYQHLVNKRDWMNKAANRAIGKTDE